MVSVQLIEILRTAYWLQIDKNCNQMITNIDNDITNIDM